MMLLRPQLFLLDRQRPIQLGVLGASREGTPGSGRVWGQLARPPSLTQCPVRWDGAMGSPDVTPQGRRT